MFPIPVPLRTVTDRVVLRRLTDLSRGRYIRTAGTTRLTGEEGAAVLEAIIATGRARWQAANGPWLRRVRPGRRGYLGDLWSLFSFAAPGLLGDRRQFNRRWRYPIEWEGDPERTLRLAQRVRPFLLRRTKAEVAPELPAKTEIVETVEMNQAQRDLYESVRLAMHERVRTAIAARGLARSHIVVLDALLKLRQVCCDLRLLRLGEDRKTRDLAPEPLVVFDRAGQQVQGDLFRVASGLGSEAIQSGFEFRRNVQLHEASLGGLEWGCQPDGGC